jgi:uncharacterized repeat protein (TIGR01451 family)
VTTDAPGISIVKTASVATLSAAGQTVAYDFRITNTGNVPLVDVTVIEGVFSGTGSLSDITCPQAAASLAPSAAVTCTATYTVTQADIDSGALTNTATATGTPPAGKAPISAPDDAIVDFFAAASVTVLKTATPSVIVSAGENVSYSFVVMNTGNVTLSDAVITETAFSGTGPVPVASCPAGAASLAPGASVTCTATYAATQADVDARIISNTAVADASQPDGTGVSSEPSSADVSVFVIALPLTGGTSTEQLLLVGGAAVLVAIILAILHHLHHASHSTRQKRTSS